MGQKIGNSLDKSDNLSLTITVKGGRTCWRVTLERLKGIDEDVLPQILLRSGLVRRWELLEDRGVDLRRRISGPSVLRNYQET